jgi:hypothetical protein
VATTTSDYGQTKTRSFDLRFVSDGHKDQWRQPVSHHTSFELDYHQKDVFFDDWGRLIEKTAANAKRVRRVDGCWRVQKNGQNGEVITYWRDNEDPCRCPVRAAWRICMRHRQRGLPAWMPLGVYIDHRKDRVFYMNVPEVENLDDKLINKLFGMHTIQVTACNELARLGVKDSFIQKRLRWPSLTFLDYLRNNIYNAHRHNLSRNIRISPKDGELHKNLIVHTGKNGATDRF